MKVFWIVEICMLSLFVFSCRGNGIKPVDSDFDKFARIYREVIDEETGLSSVDQKLISRIMQTKDLSPQTLKNIARLIYRLKNNMIVLIVLASLPGAPSDERGDLFNSLVKEYKLSQQEQLTLQMLIIAGYDMDVTSLREALVVLIQAGILKKSNLYSMRS